MKIELDMYQTLALAVLVLMLGKFLRERVRLLDKFCIPAPVIGGVLFAIFTCICYVTGVAEFAFDDTLKEVCMVMFFTSVGFQANLKVLKSGGKAMIVFLGVVIVLIVSQNFLAVGLANLLGVDPLVGLCTGSIPMVGGHGTAGAFGPVLEDFGIKGATTLCTAAATYGLIAGSMMGGPLGKMLIERHHLLDTIVPEDDSLLVEEEIKHERHSSMYPAASFQLIIAMGIGTVLSKLLSLTGMTFPIYIGAMIAGGATVMLVFQAFLNIACVIGVFPTTGKPLPFISSGGTSMIASFILVGLVLSVSAAPAAPSVYEQRRADLRLVRREPAPPAPSGRTRSGESLRSRSAGASSRSGSGRIDASARSRSARPSNRSNYRR